MSEKTQAEMNADSFEMLKDSELELDVQITKLRHLLYAEEVDLFRCACEQFMYFVDQEVEYYAKQNEGGSIYPLVCDMRRKELIDWRINDIKNVISAREDR